MQLMSAVKEGKISGVTIFFLSTCLFLSKMQKPRENNKYSQMLPVFKNQI